jgi:hypothetical protein
MDKIEDKLIVIASALIMLVIIYAGFLYFNRSNRQGQCHALNGIYLSREEICLNIEKIKLSGDE